MSIIMIDQQRRQTLLNHANKRRLNDKNEVTEIMKKMLTAFALFAVMATVFVIMSIKDADAKSVQCSITGAEFDNLMSEDAAAFMATHPGEYEEGDLQ
ncbi:MAG: hypothetical protein Q8L15_10775 [Methylobacter sp.]|nr:hypothetical protein [Methylobacter sp.]